MKKIMLIFGTRPEAIKLCPLVRELKTRRDICPLVCVTGQHRQMLDGVLRAFGVVPDYDLNIMRPQQTLFDITGAVLSGLRPVLEKERPEVVLVQGDTTTAFAAALACFYMHIPVGHVEAGLRTGSMSAPYPEEFNRQAVGLTAQYHFAPTRQAADNLLREGKSPESVFVTGNTVIDAMQYTVRPDYSHPELEWAEDKKLVFITAHRRENLGQPMQRMFSAIRRVLSEHPECRAVYPIHLNPAVRRAAEKARLYGCDNLHIIEPLEVYDCHNLEARAYLCLTDSGGIQEECASCGVPVLVMRDATERTEGAATGILLPVGSDEQRIYEKFSQLLDEPETRRRMAEAENPYGDGQACRRIADVLQSGSCEPWTAQ